MKEFNEENINYETTTSFETEHINLKISFEIYNKTVLTTLPSIPNRVKVLKSLPYTPRVKVLNSLSSIDTNTLNLVEPIKFELKLKFKNYKIKQSNYLIQLINYYKDIEESSTHINKAKKEGFYQLYGSVLLGIYYDYFLEKEDQKQCYINDKIILVKDGENIEEKKEFNNFLYKSLILKNTYFFSFLCKYNIEGTTNQHMTVLIIKDKTVFYINSWGNEEVPILFPPWYEHYTTEYNMIEYQLSESNCYLWSIYFGIYALNGFIPDLIEIENKNKKPIHLQNMYYIIRILSLFARILFENKEKITFNPTILFKLKDDYFFNIKSPIIKEYYKNVILIPEKKLGNYEKNLADTKKSKFLDLVEKYPFLYIKKNENNTEVYYETKRKKRNKGKWAKLFFSNSKEVKLNKYDENNTTFQIKKSIKEDEIMIEIKKNFEFVISEEIISETKMNYNQYKIKKITINNQLISTGVMGYKKPFKKLKKSNKQRNKQSNKQSNKQGNKQSKHKQSKHKQSKHKQSKHKQIIKEVIRKKM